jgi:hypothetical protein
MYVSYALSSVLVAASYFIAAALLPDRGSVAIALVALLPLLVLTPAIYRYSWVVWVYLDRAPGPDDPPVGPYERHRQQELAARRHPGPRR